MSTIAPVVAPPRPAKTRTTLAVLSAAPLLTLLNYTVPVVTVPQTARALGAGPTGPAWIINAISLGLAAVLLVAGAVADDHGRRRTLVLGTAVLSAGAIVAGFAPSTPVFVLARVVQGFASAAVLAASLGMIGHAFPAGPERVRATGLYGSMIGLGIAAGPLISGALATVTSWRAVYWAVAAVAAALAVISHRSLPESRADRPRPVDVPGVVTLSLGLAALVAGVIEGRLGWNRPLVLWALGTGVVLLAVFAVIELRRREPLLDLRLFTRPLFLVANAGALITGFALLGLMTFVPALLQLSHGLTPLGTAAVSTIWSGASFVTALQARRVLPHARARLSAGLALSAVGTLALLGFTTEWSWWKLTVGFVVSGIGMGLVNAALTHLAIESVPSHRAGMGSGANNTARYVGASLGVAVVTSVVGVYGPGDGVNIAIAGSAALALLAALIVPFVRGRH
ncbi:MFS transporter [Sphaerisporangium melleum]|uniref:MFS transporter n=1 Tax=Sphaerisporangium melleum TaxID=321316 RepID=A0A917RCF7_9ACTN|nr:MFS transporter [Sphaerisporangium melleum]GGK99994.1 MFS transporter [Sphaerisporangium melleum]GII71267.1 MFS transporter [Sphaerisporangium melleum]